MRLLLTLAIVGAASWRIATWAFWVVRSWCRATPGLRPWLIGAGVVAIGLAAAAMPRLGDLRPPWSESPSGLFLVLGRAIAVGIVIVLGVTTIAAAWDRNASPAAHDAD